MRSPIYWIKSAVSTVADWYLRNGFYRIGEQYNERTSWSGENITERAALNHSVVWACKRIISESVAFLPLSLMRQVGEEKQSDEKHPMYAALHNAPNAEMSAMTFRETLTGHVVMFGNCFARIFRRSGTNVANELWPLLPESVTPDHDKGGRLVYVVKSGNEQGKTYTVTRGKPQDILHIPGLGHDGIKGYSVLDMARQSFGTALSAEKYAAKFFGAGGRVPYILKATKGKFKTDQEFKEFMEKWYASYGSGENFHKAPFLEGDIEYQQIGMKPEDSQLLETRLATPAEICRWFLISPHLVGDLSKATFSNIEHLALQFVKMTLTAWLTRWEQNLWRCVLTPEEQAGGYFFRHSVNALLRGDFQTRMAGYATALQNGFINPNEVRDLEDMNRFDGGDDYHIQLNQQTLGDGVPTATQQAARLKIGTSQKERWVQ